jgi:hypothetical protein
LINKINYIFLLSLIYFTMWNIFILRLHNM